LAPVLYTPTWIAVPFPIIAAAVMIWRYTQNQSPSEGTEQQPDDVESHPEPSEDATFKELLRQAKIGRLETGADPIKKEAP
jgi:hypothetical protein